MQGWNLDQLFLLCLAIFGSVTGLAWFLPSVPAQRLYHYIMVGMVWVANWVGSTAVPVPAPREHVRRFQYQGLHWAMKG
jgi:hypothetical protein